jgi:hypothetical protein
LLCSGKALTVLTVGDRIKTRDHGMKRQFREFWNDTQMFERTWLISSIGRYQLAIAKSRIVDFGSIVKIRTQGNHHGNILMDHLRFRSRKYDEYSRLRVLRATIVTCIMSTFQSISARLGDANVQGTEYH